jgi:hypothetical protein
MATADLKHAVSRRSHIDLQGLLQLTEPKVEITARSGDVQMVQEAAKAAAKQYEEKSGRKVETNVKDGLSKDW